MVRGDVQHTALGVVLVTALEVVLRIDSHIAGWHEDILIVRDVDTCRIVHFIIGTRSNRERRYGALAMIKHRIDIGWEYALIGIVHLDSGIGPPKECLWQGGHPALNLQIGTSGA